MTFSLETLLQQPECKTLEFKRDLSSPKPILKTLVAFANTAGGRLVIGITDDQQLVGVYVRLGSTNRQADRELIAELQRSVEGIAFDEMPMPDLSINDLDLVAAQVLFGNDRLLDAQSLHTLRLLTHYQGREVPTKGAVLLFGKQRSVHFADAWIQCWRFLGTEKLDIFDHIDIHASLPTAVDEIMLFFKETCISRR